MTTTAGLGWRPDIPSHRDFRLSASRETKRELEADLAPSLFAPRYEVQPVFDQGLRGSCVGQSWAGVHAFVRKVTPRSAMFVYAECRKLWNELDQDPGAYIRDGAAVTANLGVPRDDLWPDIEKNLHLDPVDKADVDAAKRKIFKYYRVEQTAEKLACLAAGFPFVIGAAVFPSWLDDRAAQTGWIPNPGPNERMDGGHAFVAYRREANFRETRWGNALIGQGIEVSEAAYRCRNSWGEHWGQGGDFWIPAEYLENLSLADDAWTIRRTL